MKENFIDTLNAQGAGMIDTIQKLNNLAVANVEKLSALQVANMQAYAGIGIDQLKILSEVKTTEDLQDYVVHQVDVLKTVNERLVNDTRALVKLNAEFNAEVQRLAQNSMSGIINKAA
jgi:phasin family protein